MPWSMAYIYAMLPAFLLVLFRISGLMLSAPIFSSGAIPMQFKVFMAVAISLAVFPVVTPEIAAPVTLASAVTGLMAEMAIGLMIGFGVTMVFVGLQVAGQIVSQQAGIALGDVFNPMFDSSSTVVSELYFFVAMVIFLSVGGDHALMRAVLDSFETMPLLSDVPTESLAALLIDWLNLSFTIAIRMGGPTMLALLLAFLTLGFVSRTVPQLNLMTVGFPIKLAMALFIMAVTMMSLEPVLLDGIDTAMGGVRRMIGAEG